MVPSCAKLLGIGKFKKNSLLTMDRATELFQYGLKTGYWKCENIAIQLEDLSDILSVHPKYKHFRIIFCLDWSQNHKKALDNGLKASDMNLNYGGVQKSQRISTLCENSIGKYKSQNSEIAHVGAKYPHHFTSGSSGPVRMTKEQQEYHHKEDRTFKFVWKSDKQIREILVKIEIADGILQESEYSNLSLTENLKCQRKE